MITWALTRLGGFAAPILAQVVLWTGAAALAACAVAGIQTWRLDSAQKAEALAVAQSAAAAAKVEATVQLLNAQKAGEDARTQLAIATALDERPAETRTVVRTVEKAVRDDPTFATARRPAELHALRVRQLAAVDAANAD